MHEYGRRFIVLKQQYGCRHTSRDYSLILSFFTALASIVMVFGKLFFGFILGNIASTLANAEIRRVKYEEKLGAIQVCYVI